MQRPSPPPPSRQDRRSTPPDRVPDNDAARLLPDGRPAPMPQPGHRARRIPDRLPALRKGSPTP